jgi:hypothetical protein
MQLEMMVFFLILSLKVDKINISSEIIGSMGYYSVGDPAVSKNALTVGASLNTALYEDVAYFSSFGPTFDNRIKPDVVAPGFLITSARSSGI